MANIASYYVSLFEVRKLRRIACSISSLVSDCRVRPIPDPDTLDIRLHEESIITIQGGWSDVFAFKRGQL